jgi:hypothetical protein
MFLETLCTPAFIYAVFTTTQILIDLYQNNMNIVFSKTISLVVFTLLLQTLCDYGLGPVSWLIVFVPFIFTTLITFIVATKLGYNTL